MSTLSYRQLFCLLRHQRKLSARRDPLFEANKAAKWIVGFSMMLMVAYLILFAVALALDANSSVRFTSIEYMVGFAPVLLLVDFWMRVVVQQTPSQLIRPYVLLPIPRYACIDSFVINTLLSWGNLVWFALLVPYVLMSVVFSYGFAASFSLLLFFYLLILGNSQAYAIVRSLALRHVLWWGLPVVVTALVTVPLFVFDVDQVLGCYVGVGRSIGRGLSLAHLAALAVLALLTVVNRRVQYAGVWNELGREKSTTMRRVSSLHFLNRWGETGEFLKLEVKSLMRNRNPRKSLMTAVFAVVIISLIISLSDIYDGHLMTNFWCIYNYVVIPSVVLVKVMSYEGNYIDVLMVHKENILKLLTAKYYFFSLLLLLPFLLMLPMVVVGKWSLYMLVCYGVFTAGFQLFLLMQLAVYNTKTTPLNEKLTGRGGIESNYIQLVEQMLVFFLPLLMIRLLEMVLSSQAVWTVMLLIGLGFVFTHHLWLGHIYRRMMARKYESMESFHT